MDLRVKENGRKGRREAQRTIEEILFYNKQKVTGVRNVLFPKEKQAAIFSLG